MKLDTLSLNWFDYMVVGVLVVGVLRGRKRGMSEELLDVFQWLTIVVVSALFYQPMGRFLSASTGMSLLLAYVGSYLFVAVCVKLAFSGIKRAVGDKLVQSDAFGRGEYYLGMLAGGVRFLCVLFFILAVVHARYVNPQSLAANAKMQKDNFGAISFWSFGAIQQDIFKGSTSGVFIEKYLGNQLILTTPYNAVDLRKREGPARRRERMLDDALEDKTRK